MESQIEVVTGKTITEMFRADSDDEWRELIQFWFDKPSNNWRINFLTPPDVEASLAPVISILYNEMLSQIFDLTKYPKPTVVTVKE
jgi:hypothetical protein